MIIVIIGALLGGKWESKPALIIMPVIMTVFGYYIMKKLVFDLVDKVYDDGVYLYFKKGKTRLRINYKDIKNISYQVVTNPPRVTVSLRHTTPLSNELSFLPKLNFIPLKKTN